jgi:hypothetical protein
MRVHDVNEEAGIPVTNLKSEQSPLGGQAVAAYGSLDPISKLSVSTACDSLYKMKSTSKSSFSEKVFESLSSYVVFVL